LDPSEPEKIDQILSEVKPEYLPRSMLEEFMQCTVRSLLMLPKEHPQNYQKAVFLLREHCKQYPQHYAILELWKTVVESPNLKFPELIRFVDEEKAVLDEFLESQRKTFWPANSCFTVVIATTGSGENIRERKMDLYVKPLEGQTIPFLKTVTFRLHSTFYPNTVSLNQPPFRIPSLASFGTSTARVELEFCSCFLPDKEKGWTVAIEWQISPEKQGTLNQAFEINFAARTIHQIMKLHL